MDDVKRKSDLRLLWTVVVRLAIAAVSLVVFYWFYTHQDSFKPASDENFAIALMLMAGEIWPPFVAIAALFGKAKWGLLIGGLLTMTFLAYVLIAITVVGI
jgi:hypothetical protein